MNIKLFIEKKKEVSVEAESLKHQLKEFLHIKNVEDLRIFTLYHVTFPYQIDIKEAKNYLISSLTEKMAEDYYFDKLPEKINNFAVFSVSLLPGQYDQKADSAASCITLVSQIENVTVKTAKVYCVFGKLNESEKDTIKNYLVNPVDSYLIDIEEFGKDDFIDFSINQMNCENKKTFELKKEKENKKEDKKENLSEYPILKVERDSDFSSIILNYNLTINEQDLRFIYDEYKKEKRFPNLVELKILDTYWSDHCRHTTFNTLLEIENINSKNCEELKLNDPRYNTYKNYIKLRFDEEAKFRESENTNNKFTLMELATFYAKYLKRIGNLSDVEDSDENNACSIEITDKKNQKWLIEFKNETHNHPTEIEPFGGASTCIGGCIRDPLSSRAYVFGAMRVSGSADPNQSVEQTIKGKLPQRKITTFAAKGFSSYGNQIGLATASVIELYHERYVAKRLEAGAVIGATLKENVIRKRPKPGNIVMLVGGRTGRDGIGGATGSSKDHNETSINFASSEVQKGNPVIERKLQRFLSNPKVSKLILKCNDFGAGGVAVAVGELAKGLYIYLDRIPLKYRGLKPDEIILSESQERMACVIDKDNLNKFIEYAIEEDLEATYIADVVDEDYVTFYYKDKVISKISRDLLDSKGAARYASVSFEKFSIENVKKYFESYNSINTKDLLKKLNIALQIGMNQMFDSTIGGFTLILPMGGKYQLSPAEGVAYALPEIYNAESGKAVLMTMGFDPYLLEANPYVGAYYSIIESVTKIAALGGDFSKVRLSLQEYFGKTTSPKKWGVVTSAMLGALQAEMDLGIPAIGGKDSMSGTFKDIDVPPTLISFAVTVEDEEKVVPSCFIKPGNLVYLLCAPLKEDMLLDIEILKENLSFFKFLVDEKCVISARTVRSYSINETLIKSSFGNKIGFAFDQNLNLENASDNILTTEDKKNLGDKINRIINARYGSIIFETELKEDQLFLKYTEFKKNFYNKDKTNKEDKINFEEYLKTNFDLKVLYLGKTLENKEIEVIETYNEKQYAKDEFERFTIQKYSIDELVETANEPLKDVFPIEPEISYDYNIDELKKFIKNESSIEKILSNEITKNESAIKDILSAESIAKENVKYLNKNINLKKGPKALILVFSGTNCEFDTSRAFNKAGANTEIFIIKTLNKDLLNESIESCSKKILQSQIICLPGGFSMGDEPDGSGKFIASFLRTNKIKDSIEKHLEKKNLILGICNGFQALLKSGLLPYGKIAESKEDDPTLVQNLIGSHVSRFVYCKVLPNKSPWHILTDFDKTYFIPVSHGEGRFYASKEVCKNLFYNNQVSSIYVTEDGNPAIDFPYNPNGSSYSIESIISTDGLVLGKMGHSERVVEGRIKNCPGVAREPIFESAMNYFS